MRRGKTRTLDGTNALTVCIGRCAAAMNILLTFSEEVTPEIMSVHEDALRELCPLYKRDGLRVLLLMPSQAQCRAVRAAVHELTAAGALERVQGDCQPERTAGCFVVEFNERIPLDHVNGFVQPDWLGSCARFVEGATPRQYRLLPTQGEEGRLRALLADFTQEQIASVKELAVCAFCLSDEEGVERMVSSQGVAVCNSCLANAAIQLTPTRWEGKPHGFMVAVKCDFCRRAPPEIEVVMTGDEANICAECLAACREMLETS
jgi:hypothetical protein